MENKLVTGGLWSLDWIRKLLKFMKLLGVLMLIGTLQVTASAYSQKATISVELENVKLVDVFDNIRLNTSYTFVYSSEDVDENCIVSIKANDATISDVLDNLLAEKNLSYKVIDEIIIISKKKEEKEAPQPRKKISGQVFDATYNEPLPGANVVVKGGIRGTITDVDGRFTIEIVNPGAVLLVTFIGFETQEVRVGIQDEIKIHLVENVSELGQVIVTGYQEIKKERMTGAVSSMSAHEIAGTGAVSIDQAIRGQMAGVTAISTSGRPGETAQIRIRGLNSITGDMNPVWVVDGVEMQGAVPSISVGGVDLQNSLFTDGVGNIPPEDIKSITVLKDAAATAIYGARAANGVIVIETKKGVAGQKTMSFSTQQGIDLVPDHNLQMMSSAQKVEFEQRLYNDNPGLNLVGRAYQISRDMDMGILSQADGENQLQQLRDTNTDWMDVIFRPAHYQQYSLTFRGGDEEMTYYVSGNLRDSQGTLEGNNNTNFSTTFKLDYTPHEKLRIETGLRTSLRKDNYPTMAMGMDPFQYAVFANPYEKPYNADGSYAYDRTYESAWYTNSGTYEYDYNVLQDLADGNKYTEASAMTVNIKAIWDFHQSISFESLYSYSHSESQSEDWASPGSFRSLRNGWLTGSRILEESRNYNNGFLRETAGRNNEWQWRNMLTFNETFGLKHFVTALAGMEMSHGKVNNFFNFMPEFYPEYRLGGYPDLSLPLDRFNMGMLGGTAFSEDKRMSYFFTASYSYDDIYVLSGSVRYDGVNTIANTNNYTPLWNMSGKWNMHNQAFIQDVSWIDVLSFRFGYGYTGSIDRSALPFSTLKFDQRYEYDGITVPSTINWKNPDIKWEQKLDRNVGVDFSLLKNKINGSFNYYNNEVEDLLGTTSLPISSGTTDVRANVASLVNKGYEINLSTRIYERNKLSISANFNFAYNFNEITKSEYSKLTDVGSIAKRTTQPYIEGYEVQSYFGYEFAGVDPLTGNTLVYVNDASYVKPWEVHSEMNGRMVIDFDDNFNHEAAISHLGSGYPPINGGFGFSARYKNFQFNGHFTYSAGHYIPSVTNIQYNLTGYNTNTIVNDLNHWREPGDNALLPELRQGAYKNSYSVYMMDTDLEKGDFLKLASLSLNYNVPNALTSKIGLNRVKAGITAMNLATWTKYKGVDPETLGRITYPNPMRFMFNLNVEF